MRENRLHLCGLVLATALLSLACGASAKSSPSETPLLVSVPEADQSPRPAPSHPARTGRIRSDLPSLDAPRGVSERARLKYEALARRVIRAHHVMDVMGRTIPTCSLATCEARWKALAEQQLLALRAYTFECAGSSAEAKAYAELEKKHMDAVSDRYTELSVLIAEAAGSGLQRYEQLLKEHAHPAPSASEVCEDW